MRLHRLHAQSFAAIRDVDIEFGPGLNVLYGPNDLGKSTLVAAIRLALLLPHSATYSEEYVGWSSGDDPVVELTFETEAQRIWRVKKRFNKNKSGSSQLQESKNGKDFDDVERGRKVDGKLREILRWGIPEPGGAGGPRGLPESFLATALLSTQTDVSAVLESSLQADPSGSGKEQIAAALQAVAQDPTFAALLRTVQARRDDAYTDKGAKKKAKGSIFKAAAERLVETREEKERLQRTVIDSEGAEQQLRDLTERRAQELEQLTLATGHAECVELLALQACERSAAAEHVTLAREGVLRIQKIASDVEAAERKVAELIRKKGQAELGCAAAGKLKSEADAALQAAEESARASDPGLSDTVMRQQLELRKSAAGQVVHEAQQRIDAIAAAQKLVEAATAAELDAQAQQAKAESARGALSTAKAQEQSAGVELERCDLLERALEVRAAEQQAAIAQTAVDTERSVRSRLEEAVGERSFLTVQRAAMTVPAAGALVPMRKLAHELATARGALDVGFVVTVSPKGWMELRVRKDGTALDSKVTAEPLEVEASAEVEIAIGEMATVRVRGGRREAQAEAEILEDRWRQEVMPHLLAAGVADIDALDAKMTEARELDAAIQAKDGEVELLRTRIASMGGAADALREAAARAERCRAAMGGVALDSLAGDLAGLGADCAAGLRTRRQHLSKDLDAARTLASEAANASTLGEERARNAKASVDSAVLARDGALAGFPEGLEAARAAAQAALRAGAEEKTKVDGELGSLESTIAARKKRIDKVMGGARSNAEKAKAAVEAAQKDLTAAITEHAMQDGRLIELRRLREVEDLAAAEGKLREATEKHAALAVPERMVSDDEVAAAKNEVAAVKMELEEIEQKIHRANGALEQVGGAVARERLRDATEAFQLAERYEREIEAEYEAWRLLLEQMKEADAAQASNLGQAIAPGIASRFQELTKRRYGTVQLTAQLGTEGIVAAGSVRPTERLSVGTREQLSTLYRLSLAEYLQTVIVLDDQLVQSDQGRMDWFRELLQEKARTFQIVVLTCRPGDYLPESALVPEGSAVHADGEGGTIRAIDLGRAVHRY